MYVVSRTVNTFILSRISYFHCTVNLFPFLLFQVQPPHGHHLLVSGHLWILFMTYRIITYFHFLAFCDEELKRLNYVEHIIYLDHLSPFSGSSIVPLLGGSVVTLSRNIFLGHSRVGTSSTRTTSRSRHQYYRSN